MKHRKVPRWVAAIDAMSKSKQPPWGAPVKPFEMLSDLVGRVEVECRLCNRRGRYRVDKLMAEIGDQPMPEVGPEIAMRAGCNRALNPPSGGDVSYNQHLCQIRVISG